MFFRSMFSFVDVDFYYNIYLFPLCVIGGDHLYSDEKRLFNSLMIYQRYRNCGDLNMYYYMYKCQAIFFHGLGSQTTTNIDSVVNDTYWFKTFDDAIMEERACSIHVLSKDSNTSTLEHWWYIFNCTYRK